NQLDHRLAVVREPRVADTDVRPHFSGVQVTLDTEIAVAEAGAVQHLGHRLAAIQAQREVVDRHRIARPLLALEGDGLDPGPRLLPGERRPLFGDLGLVSHRPSCRPPSLSRAPWALAPPPSARP